MSSLFNGWVIYLNKCLIYAIVKEMRRLPAVGAISTGRPVHEKTRDVHVDTKIDKVQQLVIGPAKRKRKKVGVVTGMCVQKRLA